MKLRRAEAARRPTDDGQPLGVKGAGQAGCIAAPPTIIKAILDALASLGIDHIDMPATPERVRRPCGASSPARGRSDLLGPVAVAVGDYFHQVTIGVVEIDAATAVQMIDLAGPGAPRIGLVPDGLSADAGECRWSRPTGGARPAGQRVDGLPRCHPRHAGPIARSCRLAGGDRGSELSPVHLAERPSRSTMSLTASSAAPPGPATAGPAVAATAITPAKATE